MTPGRASPPFEPTNTFDGYGAAGPAVMPLLGIRIDPWLQYVPPVVEWLVVVVLLATATFAGVFAGLLLGAKPEAPP